ncbi:CypD family RiPP peptide-cysteine decarboxylase [Auritidibacter ignavus]|uniref:CypD family RiPP peptide-cysteine decarboxylase n=1 Tax=Auritidibacter ignavus TaxID=678932 RepID=A0AAJ6AIV3_9MICC|nr:MULTISPECIES: CypD family RiPP peptide-cysteine decarboxylase [Auritidibacter]AXR73800.1 Cypemycin decarboxylase [Auritidibacter sp. NML130574]WGH94085.1 CypD family RiPP peptide-cysteine decarboxylase [Auritidibacter ignavus]WHS27620.1 CypD family RiPP peptide-cysteine decarboxylase [Auritidibacter ignavus]
MQEETGRYEGTELHIHICGTIAAALTPWWIHWFRTINPKVRVNASVSTNALQFVTFDALTNLVNGRIWIDEWHDQPPPPVQWSKGESYGSECFLVFPASLDMIMRLSQGRADSPALMMLQVTRLPIVIADAIPQNNEVVDHYLSLLKTRSNIRFAPRLEGAVTISREKRSSGVNFPGAIQTCTQLVAESKV